jgi:hypothetical protein
VLGSVLEGAGDRPGEAARDGIASGAGLGLAKSDGICSRNQVRTGLRAGGSEIRTAGPILVSSFGRAIRPAARGRCRSAPNEARIDRTRRSDEWDSITNGPGRTWPGSGGP